MKRFFKQTNQFQSNAILSKLAPIPFHFIISLNPTNYLADTFDTLNFKHRFDFYWKKNAGAVLEVPSKNKPLIYNLLGTVERPESLVLTHKNLYDYFESVFQGSMLSEKLKFHLLSETPKVIFLGLPFEKWYMQMLLRILYLHKNEELIKYAAGQV